MVKKLLLEILQQYETAINMNTGKFFTLKTSSQSFHERIVKAILWHTDKLWHGKKKKFLLCLLTKTPLSNSCGKTLLKRVRVIKTPLTI